MPDLPLVTYAVDTAVAGYLAVNYSDHHDGIRILKKIPKDLFLALKRELDFVRIPQEIFSLRGSLPEIVEHLLRVLRRVRLEHARPAIF